MTIHKRKSVSTSLAAATASLKGQQLRIVQFLSENQGALTGVVAASTATGNVSDAALKANEKLEPHGWRIVSSLPKPLSENRFGERSQQHQWRLESVR